MINLFKEKDTLKIVDDLDMQRQLTVGENLNKISQQRKEKVPDIEIDKQSALDVGILGKEDEHTEKAKSFYG
jgi:hypothetical protein